MRRATAIEVSFVLLLRITLAVCAEVFALRLPHESFSGVGKVIPRNVMSGHKHSTAAVICFWGFIKQNSFGPPRLLPWKRRAEEKRRKLLPKHCISNASPKKKHTQKLST